MGIETAMLLTIAKITLIATSAAASVAGGVMAYRQGRDAAKASARQGDILARQSERASLKLARAQKTAFLSSGLTLEGEGTTPFEYMAETFQHGRDDINQIKETYGAQARQHMAQGRTGLITGIASAAGTAVMGASMFSIGGGSEVADAAKTVAGGV